MAGSRRGRRRGGAAPATLSSDNLDGDDVPAMSLTAGDVHASNVMPATSALDVGDHRVTYGPTIT
jgi:hypothetical protein